MNLNDLNVVILNFSENKIQYNFRDYFFTCWQLFIISSVNILESQSTVWILNDGCCSCYLTMSQKKMNQL